MKHQNHSQQPNDTVWLWNIFACAMGAGVLYLPINAGLNGIWPILSITIITVPMIYLAHRNLSKVVLSASKDSTNINDIISDNFSEKFCVGFAFFYFLAVYPLLLIYSVGLTNTIDSIITSNLHINPLPKPVLALIVLGILLAVASNKGNLIRKVTEMIALPLAGSLFIISCYLIPKWNFNYLAEMPSSYDFLETFILTLPVVIFSYNFSPIISTFSLNYLEKHQSPDTATEKVLWRSVLVLFAFIMFFIISCILAVNQEQMVLAKQQNKNILVFMGDLFDDPILHMVSPIVALIAMTGAFLGSFFGAREAVIGLIEQKLHSHKIKSKKLNKIAMAIVFIPCYLFSIFDTNILNFMGMICGPVIAVLLFIFPVFAIYQIDSLSRYRKTWKDKINHIFIVIMGLIACSAILYSFKYLLKFLK